MKLWKFFLFCFFNGNICCKKPGDTFPFSDMLVPLWVKYFLFNVLKCIEQSCCFSVFLLLQSTINPVDGIYQPSLATPVDDIAMPTQTTLPTGWTPLFFSSLFRLATKGDNNAPCWSCRLLMSLFPLFFFFSTNRQLGPVLCDCF